MFPTRGATTTSVVGIWLIVGFGLGGNTVGERVGDFVIPNGVGRDDKVGFEEGNTLGDKVGGLEIVGVPVG
jgi:hypothetical protein